MHRGAADARFGVFRLWADDGDGVSEAGELVALSERGVVSISLRSDGAASADAAGNRIFGWTDVTMADGSTVRAADAALAFEPLATATRDIVSDSFDLSSILSTPGQVAALIEQALTTIDPASMADAAPGPDTAMPIADYAVLWDDDAFRF